jgi:hypothetical protein
MLTSILAYSKQSGRITFLPFVWVGRFAGQSAIVNAMRSSEPQIRHHGAELNPAIKAWLDNVLVPALVRRWVSSNAVGQRAIIPAPPPRTDSEISKKLQSAEV